MRFASVLHEGRPLAVAIEGDRAIPLRGLEALGLATPSTVLADPPLDRCGSLPLAEVRHRPGCRRCSLAGPFDPLPCPPESGAIDYEGELTVVIGTPARRVPEDRALSVVAGYCVANDITMRDYQNKTHQWLQGKAWETSTPVGPELVTADAVGDPGALTLRTTVNGQIVQEAGTDRLIFSVPRLISAISQFAALMPGDLILTGTPAGVGFRREPPLLLAGGDTVAVEVDGVGRIENRMFAEGLAPA